MQTDESPTNNAQSRPTHKTLQDLKKLNPRTQAVILGKAIAMRKEKDTKLRSQLETHGVAGAAHESPAVTLTKAAL